MTAVLWGDGFFRLGMGHHCPTKTGWLATNGRLWSVASPIVHQLPISPESDRNHPLMGAMAFGFFGFTGLKRVPL